MVSVEQPLTAISESHLLEVEVATERWPVTGQAHNDHSSAFNQSINPSVNQSIYYCDVHKPLAAGKWDH